MTFKRYFSNANIKWSNWGDEFTAVFPSRMRLPETHRTNKHPGDRATHARFPDSGSECAGNMPGFTTYLPTDTLVTMGKSLKFLKFCFFGCGLGPVTLASCAGCEGQMQQCVGY